MRYAPSGLIVVSKCSQQLVQQMDKMAQNQELDCGLVVHNDMVEGRVVMTGQTFQENQLVVEYAGIKLVNFK